MSLAWKSLEKAGRCNSEYLGIGDYADISMESLIIRSSKYLLSTSVSLF
jgi:hypothetical protein